MKLTICCTAAILITLSACVTNSPVPTCSVSPPINYKGDTEAATKVSLDLSKLASSPINVELEIRYKTSVDAAFQKIPEESAACMMVLQSVLCLSQRRDEGGDKLASELIKYIAEKNICSQELQLFVQ